MLMRIALLLSITWVMSLGSALSPCWFMPVSGRDLIWFGGGLFLMGKSTLEIHGSLEGEAHEHQTKARPKFFGTIVQSP